MGSLANRLNSLMQEKNIGLNELAQVTGIKETRLKRIIDGQLEDNVYMSEVQAICDYLKISFDYLVGETDIRKYIFAFKSAETYTSENGSYDYACEEYVDYLKSNNNLKINAIEFSQATFAQRLVQLMNERNINEGTLAKEIRISKRTILKYIKDENSNPSTRNLAVLATYFNITIPFLIGETKVRRWAFKMDSIDSYNSFADDYMAACKEYISFLKDNGCLSVIKSK